MAAGGLKNEVASPPQNGSTTGSIVSSTERLMQPGSQQKQSTKGTPGLPVLVDIAAVSRSFSISTRQVRRFVADGQIPFVRVGHLIRFDLDEMKEWIDARRARSVTLRSANPATSSSQGRPKVGEADP